MLIMSEMLTLFSSKNIFHDFNARHTDCVTKILKHILDYKFLNSLASIRYR